MVGIFASAVLALCIGGASSVAANLVQNAPSVALFWKNFGTTDEYRPICAPSSRTTAAAGTCVDARDDLRHTRPEHRPRVVCAVYCPFGYTRSETYQFVRHPSTSCGFFSLFRTPCVDQYAYDNESCKPAVEHMCSRGSKCGGGGSKGPQVCRAQVPSFEKSIQVTRVIPENSQPGTPVPGPIFVENATLYGLTGVNDHPQDTFGIDGKTGQLFVANPEALDFEGKPLMNLLVLVSVRDSDKLVRVSVSIILHDRPEALVLRTGMPSCESIPLEFTVPANATRNTIISETGWPAQSPDAGTVVRYQISGVDAASFNISPDDGTLSTSETFNSSAKEYDLEVSVMRCSNNDLCTGVPEVKLRVHILATS